MLTAAFGFSGFPGLGWRAQRRRGGDGAESDKRIEERLDALGAEFKDNRDKVLLVRINGAVAGRKTGPRLDSMRGETRQSAFAKRNAAKWTRNAKPRTRSGFGVGGIFGRRPQGHGGQFEQVARPSSGADGMRRQINDGLKETRESGEKKLEQIRATVDEKLQTTLEKRLGEQFGIVRPVGKCPQGAGGNAGAFVAGRQPAAVLTSARARGQWGEVVLKDIIRQILTSDQAENVEFDGGERVEFAIRIPVEPRPAAGRLQISDGQLRAVG